MPSCAGPVPPAHPNCLASAETCTFTVPFRSQIKNVEQHEAKGRPQWHSTSEVFADQCQPNTNTLGAALVSAGRQWGIVGKSLGRDSSSAPAGCAALGKLLNLSESHSCS